MSKAKTLPPRSKVKTADTWNLAAMFKTDADWETAFTKWEEQIPGYEKFKGHLGDSAEMLAACLQFDAAIDRAAEQLGVYAFLKTAEDQANSDYQRMKGRYQHVATKASEAASFIRPEIMAIPQGEDGRIPASPANSPNGSSPSNASSAIAPTRSATRKSSCWPCRAR